MHNNIMLKFLLLSLLIISIIILYCNIPNIAGELGMTPTHNS